MIINTDRGHYECKVCDFTSDTKRGIEIHISKKARNEEEYGRERVRLFNSSVIPFRHQFIL